jgi:hypothetical protein
VRAAILRHLPLAIVAAFVPVWAGAAAWATWAPHSLALALWATAGLCTGALLVLGGSVALRAAGGHHGGRKGRPWAPPRSPDRPAATLEGHPIPAADAWQYGIPLPELPPQGPPWGPAEPPERPRPASWGAYPAPHTDEDDSCRCPDHATMRGLRAWS